MFYGWWIIILVFLSSMFFNATIFSGFTAYFNPLVEEFGWSYASISLAASIRILEVGLMSFAMGILLDRFGSRKMAFLSCILIGLGFIMLSNINSLATFYIVFAVICIGGSGLCPVFITHIMSHWFQKRLGLAMGITLAGLGAGGFTIPLIVFLLDFFGWRNTFIIIGVTGFILGILLLVFLRNKPQDIGSTLDGLPEDELQSTSTDTHRSNNASGAPYHDFSLREALSNRSFWIVAYMGLSGIFSTNMITTHVMPYLEDIGYVRSLAGVVAMMIPVMSIVGRLGVGWVSDFMSSKTIWLGVIACQVVGVVFFINAHLSFVLIPFVIIYGIGYGGNVVISLRILRSYFGKGQIGSITGASLAISITGAFVSPWVAGFVFDTTGSYNIAWLISIALLMMGIPLVLSMRNPQASGTLNSPAFS